MKIKLTDTGLRALFPNARADYIAATAGDVYTVIMHMSKRHS